MKQKEEKKNYNFLFFEEVFHKQRKEATVYAFSQKYQQIYCLRFLPHLYPIKMNRV